MTVELGASVEMAVLKAAVVATSCSSFCMFICNYQISARPGGLRAFQTLCFTSHYVKSKLQEFH